MGIKTAVTALILAGFIAGTIVTGRFQATAPSVAAPTLTDQARPASLPSSLPASSALPDLSSVAERALKVSA